MKLENLKLAGFRRFEEPTNIQLSGKLVAISGPNEAGKTTALRAIHHFSHSDPIEAQDKTTFYSGKTYIRLSFFLDEDDLDAAGLTEPTWLFYTKNEDGNFNWSFKPHPPRDLVLRTQLKASLNRLTTSISAKNALLDENPDFDLELIDQCAESCESLEELTSGETETLRELASELPDLSEKEKGPAYLKNLKKNVAALLEFEADHFPRRKAFEAIKERIPEFLFFTEAERKIEIPYDIRLLKHPNAQTQKSPSKALGEIIRMAELDLNSLIAEQSAGNTAGTQSLIEAANEKLRALSEGVWNQSDACLRFSLDGPNLDLFVENREGFDAKHRLSNLSARSDGYRQFVALFVFTFLSEKQNAIILIDEVEQHLHYDAQADLIQHLQNDSSIAKVIYSTHSAGALPEDLGTGIRLIKWADDNPKRSVAINKFWHEGDGTAFRPLLFGMGATTFAFFPTRKALLAEGPTELLLMPRLMKEACEAQQLGFQVVHGLSNFDPERLAVMGGVHSNVAYFVDNDKGGKDLAKELSAANVPNARLFHVGEVGPFTTLEDLINPDVWKKAVNGYIDKYGDARGVTEHIRSAPARGRIAKLPEAIRKEKVSFAYNILDLIAENPNLQILSPRAKPGLEALTERIWAQLDLERDGV